MLPRFGTPSAKQNMIKNFLRMGTRDRLRLVIFVLLFVGAVLLWPILFCVKVDGDTSAKWVALWTPLWIYDALGEFVSRVVLGWRPWVEAREGGERGRSGGGIHYSPGTTAERMLHGVFRCFYYYSCTGTTAAARCNERMCKMYLARAFSYGYVRQTTAVKT